MKEYLKITIAPVLKEDSEILIAQISDLDFYAFEEEDNALSAFIVPADFHKEAFEALLPDGAGHTVEVIAEENWNRRWEESFDPVRVGNFAAIRADFHPVIQDVRYEIIVTPKMSFGTGHHATTWMMLDLMGSLSFHNKSVVDFGTGTGVLAILAEKMGASSVVGIDNDDWSIENAQENLAANDCSKTRIVRGDDVRVTAPADIILANINLNVLLSNAASLGENTNANGYLLLSGFLQDDVQAIESAFTQVGFAVWQKRSKSNWVALALSKI